MQTDFWKSVREHGLPFVITCVVSNFSFWDERSYPFVVIRIVSLYTYLFIDSFLCPDIRHA